MFINKYLVPFKVTALRYNILMLAFFRSWKRQQLLFRFFFNLLNRSKTLSFIRCLQFWEEEKFSGGQVWWIRCLRHDYGFVFGQKLTLKHQCVSRCVNMMPNPWLVFPQFCAFLTNFFAELAHNFKVVFLIDRTTLWQEFMMHQAIAIKENSGQNLHIRPNLTSFFRSCLFWTLALGWLDFAFATSYDPFEQSWGSSLNVVSISCAMSMHRSFCSRFSSFETIFAAAPYLPKTSVKIDWHEPNDMTTSSATSILWWFDDYPKSFS